MKHVIFAGPPNLQYQKGQGTIANKEFSLISSSCLMQGFFFLVIENVEDQLIKTLCTTSFLTSPGQKNLLSEGLEDNCAEAVCLERH